MGEHEVTETQLLACVDQERARASTMLNDGLKRVHAGLAEGAKPDIMWAIQFGCIAEAFEVEGEGPLKVVGMFVEAMMRLERLERAGVDGDARS